MLGLGLSLWDAALSGGAFLPSKIPNLTLWLSGDSGATTDDGVTQAIDGQAVKQWNGQSTPAVNATQGSAGSRPTFKSNIINGKPVLRFTAHSLVTGSFLDSSYNTACTFFTVRNKTSGNLKLSASHNSTRWWTARDQGNTRFYTDQLSVADLPMPCPGPGGKSWALETFRYNGSAKVARINRFAVGQLSATGNLTLNGTLTIGDYSVGGFAWDGDIAEMIMYNRALTNAELTQVENYLLVKYGLLSQAGTMTALPLLGCLGDSLTQGAAALSDISDTYPYKLQVLLGGDSVYHLANCGVGGQTTATWLTTAATQFDQSYSSSYPRNIALVFTGTNDLYFGATAATTYANIVTLCQARQAAGWKVVVFTILPRTQAGTPGSFEADRQTVNTNIRTNRVTFADGLCDTGLDASIGVAGASTDATYYNADQVHLNATGNGVVAGLAYSAVLALP